MTEAELRALYYRQAISRIESGSFDGNYSAIGPKTRSGDRAYGRYQVMGNNIPSWTEKWYGKRLTPAEFRANPAAQDAVFDGEFGSYVSRYGEGPAAVKWFTGSHIPKGRSDGYTVDNDYQSRFLTNLQKLHGTQPKAVSYQPTQVSQVSPVSQPAQTAVTQGIASLPTVQDVAQPAPNLPVTTPNTTTPTTTQATPFGGIFNAMLQNNMASQQWHQSQVAAAEEPMMRQTDPRPPMEKAAATSQTPNVYYDYLKKRLG